MASEQKAASVAAGHVEQLEEIARQLTTIHVSLASNLDGGRELQTWTRKQVEDLLRYVDHAIDRHATGENPRRMAR
jgi:hypothetical protein